MEPAAGERICEEWSSLSGLHTSEEALFMTQLIAGNYSHNSSTTPNSLIWPDHDESTGLTLETNSCFPSNIFWLLQGGSSSSSTTSTDNNANNNIIIPSTSMINQNSPPPPPPEEDRSINLEMESPPKRFKSSTSIMEVGSAENSKNNVKRKKKSKSDCMSSTSEKENEEDGISQSCGLLQRKSSSMGSCSCCFSQVISASPTEELIFKIPQKHPPIDLNIIKCKSVKPNNKGGPATDPQSLYARRRRERINQRLRILQNLVPNGTKVDISTMLEEAVQYVKFLQLQIKLLSSDDTWMYAPIAYNGINIIGLDLNNNITQTKQP